MEKQDKVFIVDNEYQSKCVKSIIDLLKKDDIEETIDSLIEYDKVIKGKQNE